MATLAKGQGAAFLVAALAGAINGMVVVASVLAAGGLLLVAWGFWRAGQLDGKTKPTVGGTWSRVLLGVVVSCVVAFASGLEWRYAPVPIAIGLTVGILLARAPRR